MSVCMHMFQENGFKGPCDLQGPSEPNLGYMYVYGAGWWWWWGQCCSLAFYNLPSLIIQTEHLYN